jgi:F-type H+-transporting ATPase subunit alpha
LLDKYPTSALKRYEQELYQFIEQKYPELEKEIAKKKALDSELEGRLKAALEEFAGKFTPEG